MAQLQEETRLPCTPFLVRYLCIFIIFSHFPDSGVDLKMSLNSQFVFEIPAILHTDVLYIICIVLLCVLHVWQFRSSQIWIFYSSCFQMIENSKICVILPEVQNEPDVQRKVMRKGVHIKSILMQACVIFYSELERELNIQYLSCCSIQNKVY